MNEWVEETTQGHIQDLIPEGYVDYSTKASIVNAAYFKGQWLSQFKPKDTKFGNFYITRDQIRMVKFMVQKGSFNYYVSEELQAHVLEMPYEGDHGDPAGGHGRDPDRLLQGREARRPSSQIQHLRRPRAAAASEQPRHKLPVWRPVQPHRVHGPVRGLRGRDQPRLRQAQVIHRGQ